MVKKTIYVLFFFVLISCHRREFKTYLGVYDCSEFTFTSTPGEPNVYTITTGHEVEVIREDKQIIIFERKFHIDSIEPNQNYHTSSGIDGDIISFDVLFVNDSLYFESTRNQGDGKFTYRYFGSKMEN